MDTDELDNLADQLRRTFYRSAKSDTLPMLWEDLGPFYQNIWKDVAREAHKWLVG